MGPVIMLMAGPLWFVPMMVELFVSQRFWGGFMLDQIVADHVAQGWTIESRTESQAVMSRKARIGWFWNILLSVLTGGIWLVVVFFKLVNRKTQRKVVTVDAAGKVTTR